MLTAKELCEQIKQDKLDQFKNDLKIVLDILKKNNGKLCFSNYIFMDSHLFYNHHISYYQKFIMKNFDEIAKILIPLGYKINLKDEGIEMFSQDSYMITTTYSEKKNIFGVKTITGSKRIYHNLGLDRKVIITIEACCGEE